MCMLGDLRGAIKNTPGSPLSAEVQGGGPKILTFQSQMLPLPCRERMRGTPQLFSPPSFSLSGMSPDGNTPAEHPPEPVVTLTEQTSATSLIAIGF